MNRSAPLFSCLREVRLSAGKDLRLPPRGQGPFLFLRKKKRALTPKKKLGPVYGRFGVENGGIGLSYDRKDPFRPLRPAPAEQGEACALTSRRLRVPLSGPGWSGTPSAAHRGTRERRASFVGRDALPPHSAARVAPPGGGWIELPTFPYFTMAWP